MKSINSLAFVLQTSKEKTVRSQSPISVNPTHVKMVEHVKGLDQIGKTIHALVCQDLLVKTVL